MIWHIGNTTVRNPNRIRDALIAYEKNGLIDDLFESNDLAHSKLYDVLKEDSIIDSNREDISQKAWYGRKWRLAFYEMGLIANKNNSNYFPGEITKTGKALINSNSDAEIQNIFLRIIFNLETRKKGYKTFFRPVPFILEIVKNLKKKGEEAKISKDEFILFLQNYNEELSTKDYVNKIIRFRENKKTTNNYSNLINNYYRKFMENIKLKEGTVRADYPDVTFRLLFLTGLFLESGKGFIINPQYETLAEMLSEDKTTQENNNVYYEKLSELPSLPTDKEKDLLIKIINDNYNYIRQYTKKNQNIDLSKSIKELELFRVKQDNQIRIINENIFAKKQISKDLEIIKWIENIEKNKTEDLFRGEDLIFPRNERPQYFEWAIWRSFLSINQNINNPEQARNFKLDLNFRPINHAPPGKPDMIFEFENFTLIIEVTLSTSSRQTAMEGEPVRRHVAEIEELNKKPVYCLFIATKIDINTYDEFFNGRFIIKKDNKHLSIQTKIIPLSLHVFIDFFKKIEKSHANNPRILECILFNCISNKGNDVMSWEKKINNFFLNYQLLPY